jgi:hypothetical protein
MTAMGRYWKLVVLTNPYCDANSSMAAYSWLGVKPRRRHKNRKGIMPLQNRLITLIPVMMLAFGIIAVAALYFAGGYILSQRDDLVAHGVQTSGTITGTDCTIRVSRKTRYGPSVDYEFLAGQLYQDRGTVASVEECLSMRPGSTIEITYLPDDPETSLPHGKAALDNRYRATILPTDMHGCILNRCGRCVRRIPGIESEMGSSEGWEIKRVNLVVIHRFRSNGVFTQPRSVYDFLVRTHLV